MSDPQPITPWKKFAIRGFFGGVGFALALALLAGAAVWYHNRPERPKPWNNTVLKATFDTMGFTTGGSSPKDAYPVEFYYNVQNNTDKNYPINGSTFTPMAVLTRGNVLSKEFGNYQIGDATVDGPPFIPPGGTARITLRISYQYPNEFTQADKDDAKKIIKAFNHRLKELNGFVIFDEQNHYRVDLPEGWKNWDGVKPDSSSPEPKN